MRRMRTIRLAVLGLLLSGVLAGAAGAGTATRSASARAFVLGPSGVRRIQVGRSYSFLRSRHLVERIHPGCELAGPGQDFYAVLHERLGGLVEFNARRRAVKVSVTRGAVTARGVGIGATLGRVKRSYPRQRYRLDSTFGVYFVHVGPRSGGFTITISGRSRRVVSLSAHYPPICE